MIDEVTPFNAITIRIASPQVMRSWSKGEVVRAKINPESVPSVAKNRQGKISKTDAG